MSISGVIEADVALVRDRAKSELAALDGAEVLVTGGAGFLGYLLLHVLAEQGTNVTVYENFRRGRRQWLDDLVERSPNLRLREHDISTPLPVEADRYDWVIHAASIASPIFYRQFPIETIDANVNGIRSLLDLARTRADQGRAMQGILFFSTSEIYGDPSPDSIPTPETYRGFVSCTGPRACYDESKRLGETLCVNFARQYGVQVTSARPFNNYGPGLNINDRRVIPDLARDIFAGRDLVLLSDGAATRTFCYVADAIVGYLKVLVNGRAGEAYNIGTESPEISMRQLAEALRDNSRDLCGYTGQVITETSDDADYLIDNPNRRCPDITKARTELGYEPVVALDDGLRQALRWYQENQS